MSRFRRWLNTWQASAILNAVVAVSCIVAGLQPGNWFAPLSWMVAGFSLSGVMVACTFLRTMPKRLRLTEAERAMIDRDVRDAVRRAMTAATAEHGLTARELDEEEVPPELRAAFRRGVAARDRGGGDGDGGALH